MDPAVEEGRREATVTTFVYADDSGPLGMLVLDHTKQEIHWIRSHPDATGGVAQLLEDAARKKLGGAYEAYRTNSDLTIQGRQFGLRNQARERLTGRPIEEAESIRDVLRRGAAGEDVADSEIDDVLAAMGRAPRDGEMPRDVFTDRAEQWHAGASGSRSVDETGALRSEEQIVSSDLFQMSDEDLGAIADAYGVERGTRDEMLDALHARVGEDIPLTDDWAEPFDPASRFTSPERTQAFLEQHRQRIATDRKWQNQLRGIVQDVRSTPSGKAPFSKAEIEDLMATFPAEKYPVTERYLRSTHPGSNLENAAFTTTNKGKVVLASEEHLDDLEMTLRLIGSNRSAAHVILSDSPIRIGRSEDFLDSAETAAHKRLGEPDIEHFVRNQDRYNFVDGRPVNNPLPEYMRSYYSTMMETSTVDNLMAMRDEQGSQALLNQLTQHGLAGDDYAVVAQMLDELDVGVQGSFVRSAAKEIGRAHV